LISARGKLSFFAIFFVLFALTSPVIVAADLETPYAVPRTPYPKKIVSINLCTDELLLELVGPERVAAVTKFSTDAEVSTVAAQAKGISQTQGDIEHVLAFGPDMLLSGHFSNKETIKFFEKSGVPVLIFKLPKSFEDIYEALRRLAIAVGEMEKGEAIIGKMQTELAGFKKISLPQRAVFFQSDNYVPGVGTFENAVMEAAGLRNVAVELGIKDYGRMGLEELIRAKPDVIIFSSEQKKTKTVRGEVLDHPALKKALPHVKTVTIPTLYLNCGSPDSVKAVKLLVQEINS